MGNWAEKIMKSISLQYLGAERKLFASHVYGLLRHYIRTHWFGCSTKNPRSVEDFRELLPNQYLFLGNRHPLDSGSGEGFPTTSQPVFAHFCGSIRNRGCLAKFLWRYKQRLAEKEPLRECLHRHIPIIKMKNPCAFGGGEWSQ